MKIGVLIKQVPDTATQFKVKSDGSSVETAGIKWDIGPYDKFALEAALRIKERLKAGQVIAVSLGEDRCIESLIVALAVGADRAIQICSDLAEIDAFVTARALAGLARQEAFDLILCGKQATDLDQNQVAQYLAFALNIGCVTVVESIDIADDQKRATVLRRISGGAKEKIQVSFPAILTCEKGLPDLRYTPLPGLMKAKKMPIEKRSARELSGGAEPKIYYRNFRLPPQKQPGRILNGEPDQVVKELVRLLREEAKVI